MNIGEELFKGEIWCQKDFGDNWRIDEGGHDEGGYAHDDNKDGEHKRNDGEVFDGEAEMGVQKRKQDNK